MRISVDQTKCQGHGRCAALLPELFTLDDFGLSSVTADGTVPPDLERKARLAVANCPEYAVQITDD
jgi:ferredoxin